MALTDQQKQAWQRDGFFILRWEEVAHEAA